MRYLVSLAACFFIALINTGCKSDSDTNSNPADPNSKSYTIEYKVTSTGKINEIKYRTQNGDTLTAIDALSGWSYKWVGKGKTGEKTYIKISLNKSVTKVYFQIMANDLAVVSDSLTGLQTATVSMARGATLP